MKYVLFAALLLSLNISPAQNLLPLELTSNWLEKIKDLAPNEPTMKVDEKRDILIFSLHTGYEHWTIPHTEAVVKAIAEKSGAFNVHLSKDISMFEPEQLDQFDAIVLNNNCSVGERRNLFWDQLKAEGSLSDEQCLEKAADLEQNLLDYVGGGHGLMVLHGGIVMQNKSAAFGKMVGGSFDYHPKQQVIHVKPTDPSHPLLQGIDPEGFLHVDEPYLFNGAYFDYNFKPLLYMECDEIHGFREPPKEKVKYISWIKNHGKGRVFFSSPSHNAQSMENPALLRFFLDGLQYAVGDFPCDATPIGKMNVP